MTIKSGFIPLHVSAAALVLCASVTYASAPPTLTAAGSAMGFVLSTVVSGLPPSNSSSFNVLGSAINSDGNIILNNSGTATNYVFKNMDGQTVADALSSASFSNFPSALAFSSGSVWASGNGVLTKLNNDGSVAQVYSDIPTTYGMWTNPVTSHLISVSSLGLIDINVSGAAPSFTALPGSSSGADGLTVSPDGKFAYGSQGAIYDLTTQSAAGSFGSVPGADGMGVITSSSKPELDGDIVVNTTNGNIVLVDHVTFTQTIIASGGGYGDYASPDYTNGTLLLSSSNNLLRLSCGADCGFVTPPVPEPETYAMFLAGLGVMSFIARRRKQK